MNNNSLTKLHSPIEMWRKPISYLIVGFGAMVALFTLPHGHGTGWYKFLEMTGFLLLILAALGRIWATAYIAGRKTSELCQQGPYSLTRNPLYFFSFIGVVGFGFAVQHLILGAVMAVVFLIYYRAVIRSEESRLGKVHGSAFDEYCARTPRFWPRWRQLPSSEAEVALKIAPFTRGLREVFWFLAAIIMADTLEWMHGQHLWPAYVLPF